jgi:hypothetical protein
LPEGFPRAFFVLHVDDFAGEMQPKWLMDENTLNVIEHDDIKNNIIDIER